MPSPQSKILTSFLLAVLAVFAPIKEMVVTVLVFVVADLVTGLWASRKKGAPITSSGLRRTVGKSVVYMAALCFGYLLEHFLLADLPVTKIVAGTIGLTEFKSLMENLETITGQPIIKLILDRVARGNPTKSE